MSSPWPRSDDSVATARLSLRLFMRLCKRDAPMTQPAHRCPLSAGALCAHSMFLEHCCVLRSRMLILDRSACALSDTRVHVACSGHARIDIRLPCVTETISTTATRTITSRACFTMSTHRISPNLRRPLCSAQVPSHCMRGRSRTHARYSWAVNDQLEIDRGGIRHREHRR